MAGTKSNQQQKEEILKTFEILSTFAMDSDLDFSFKWVYRTVIAVYDKDALGRKVNIIPLTRDFTRHGHSLSDNVSEEALALVTSYCGLVEEMILSATPPKKSQRKIRLKITPELDTLTEEDEEY